MNKNDLIANVYKNVNDGLDVDKTPYTKSAVREFVNTVFDALTELIKTEDRVSISGFGTFETKDVMEHEGRNPQNGETVTIPEHKRIRFKASKVLKDIVNA